MQKINHFLANTSSGIVALLFALNVAYLPGDIKERFLFFMIAFLFYDHCKLRYELENPPDET